MYVKCIRSSTVLHVHVHVLYLYHVHLVCSHGSPLLHPSLQQPPQLRMANITDYLELTNLGLPEMQHGLPVTYYHNITVRK